MCGGLNVKFKSDVYSHSMLHTYSESDTYTYIDDYLHCQTQYARSILNGLFLLYIIQLCGVLFRFVF